MAQRLVRKLCSSCKQTRTATAPEQKIIDRVLSKLSNKTLIPAATNTVYDAAPEGCKECGGRGYKGRIGIFEAIFMDEAIEKILREKPSEREVAEAALAQNIPTMPQDGILKVLRGVTSLEELGRVVDLDLAN
jgi:type II secretory ATPase GspE/PulE/Tfp pilus assembly ATPase PilB-like protein